MTITLTFITKQTKQGYVGFVAEIPGVATQGKTAEDITDKLWDALRSYLRLKRVTAHESPLYHGEVSTETFTLEAQSSSEPNNPINWQ